LDRSPAEAPVGGLTGALSGALERTRARIHEACRAAQRSPDSVRLIAVSKTHPAAVVRAAYDAGQRDFGESYAQELAEKAAALTDLPDLRWHFIGPLQRNKAKLVGRYACSMHAVESARTAAAVAASASDPVDAFVQVNVAAEVGKHGIAPGALPGLLAELEAIPNLRVVGLMTLPPPDLESARHAFVALRALAATHRLPELSMGMSDDLEAAIAAGSTYVRIGSAIFGDRPPR
jgi:PLP dependent protein